MQTEPSGESGGAVGHSGRRGVGGFEAAYRAYAVELERYAHAIVRDVEAARDIAHDALVRALERLSTDAVPRELRPWLFRVTHNRALDHLRLTRGTTVADPHALAELRDALPRERPPWGAAEKVHHALDRLSPAQRRVMALRYMLGFSPAEAGAVLGTTSDSVRHTERRALISLRNRIGTRADLERGMLHGLGETVLQPRDPAADRGSS